MICYKCKKDLPNSSFNKAIRNTHREGLQSYCKSCMLIYGKLHRQNNIHHYRAKSRLSNASPQRRLKLLLNANTVDRSLLDFDWAWNKLVALHFKCEITGVPFTWEPRQPTSLSIDKIDPTIGYTKDNVRFVCWWVNAAMGNWGLEKLKQLIKESNLAN